MDTTLDEKLAEQRAEIKKLERSSLRWHIASCFVAAGVMALLGFTYGWYAMGPALSLFVLGFSVGQYQERQVWRKRDKQMWDMYLEAVSAKTGIQL